MKITFLEIKTITLLTIIALMFTSCTENYSNGERIGMITQFSKTGLVFKTHEGHLNLTQTGMNSSSTKPFDFSVDRDNEDPKIVATLDSAATYGWKVKIKYHEVFGWNWFSNRGETDHFVSDVQVLDSNPIGHIFGDNDKTTSGSACGCKNEGKVIDTIYVVIDKTK
jgi:hypothetical protein